MVVLPCFIGIHFDVHNGSDKYSLIRITDKMIGLKFGELCFTRKRTKHKVKK